MKLPPSGGVTSHWWINICILPPQYLNFPPLLSLQLRVNVRDYVRAGVRMRALINFLWAWPNDFPCSRPAPIEISKIRPCFCVAIFCAHSRFSLAPKARDKFQEMSHYILLSTVAWVYALAIQWIFALVSRFSDITHGFGLTQEKKKKKKKNTRCIGEPASYWKNPSAYSCSPPPKKAYEISNISHGISGFLDRFLRKISGFREGFLDFRWDFKISSKISRFQGFEQDFKIDFSE